MGARRPAGSTPAPADVPTNPDIGAPMTHHRPDVPSFWHHPPAADPAAERERLARTYPGLYRPEEEPAADVAAPPLYALTAAEVLSWDA